MVWSLKYDLCFVGTGCTIEKSSLIDSTRMVYLREEVEESRL